MRKELIKMDLQQALLLLVAIADEGPKSYSEEYENGNVEKAIKTVDDFLNLLSKVD